MESNMGSSGMASRPLDALNKSRNQRVIIDLKNGKQLVGKLKAFDIHINVVLEDAEERVDGEVKRKLGNVFLRGDTIIMLSTE
jgi:small nuclear ribonucleoprotein